MNSLHKRVDGPIQCGPGSPCKDNSCCGPEGKCGYKEQNCGAGCTSNCEAKAMCGIDSADGKTRCGLNLCCSHYGWCGTEDVHCKDPEPQFGKSPCQVGFGSCQKYPSPSCSGRSASTGRRVGYYQGWNVRERTCDIVRPAQINTKGLTHLFFSFVFFDPTTFNIMPMNAADPPLYREFTKLATNGLQTWVAIGGWSFSDPGNTHTAWSDMCATAAGRAAFIKSLIAFMDEYGFQGADLDWEYPEDAKRGGKPSDGDNLVLLVKEMRAAFGSRYGLSLTLAPDYWYLRGFRPAKMQQYVDFMGFMSYDLHGPWDTDVKALGSIVRPQTDITEIYQNFKPLWFDGVDPAKMNMGLAYYGRTYKLVDASCGKMGCSFDGPGAAGSCTASEGVLSNREIQQMIKKDGLTPYFNQTAMVKYLTYGGNNWVGYDDPETLALKESFANSLCLGGLMIWSIDFDVGVGSGL
ncbi:glycoside hydrolase family 18 protein, partial [Dothidotthia symphoricarpi CBS 119687]